MVIRKTNSYDRLYLISLLSESEAGRYVLRNNFDIFLEHLVAWHRCGFAFSKLRDGGDFDPFLDENIEKIIDRIEPEDILETTLALSHISDKSDSVIDNCIRTHKRDYVHTMYLDGLLKRIYVIL